MSAKIIRANGASHRVAIARPAGGGLRIDGAEGLAAGEKLLVLLPDGASFEVVIRWASGDQAGAVILD